MARSLLDLPSEIRQLIYNFALVKDELLDLWPASKYDVIPYPDAHYTTRDHRGDWAKFRLAIWSMRQGLTVNILRACKTINSEATPILYGRNEFRFTMEDGWVPLHIFLIMIGKRNRAHIKSLSVFVPLESLVYETQSVMPETNPSWASAASTGSGSDVFQGEQPLCAAEAVKGCCEFWMEEKTLRTLFLVMPPGLHLDRDAFHIGLFEYFALFMGVRDELSLEIKLVVYQDAKIGEESWEKRDALQEVEDFGWETLIWFQGRDEYQVAVFEEIE